MTNRPDNNKPKKTDWESIFTIIFLLGIIAMFVASFLLVGRLGPQ